MLCCPCCVLLAKCVNVCALLTNMQWQACPDSELQFAILARQIRGHQSMLLVQNMQITHLLQS